MAKRYGHIGQVAQRQAVEVLDRKPVKKEKKKRLKKSTRGPATRSQHEVDRPSEH